MELTECIEFYKKNKWSFIPFHRPGDGHDGKQPMVNWTTYMSRLPLDSEIDRWFSSGNTPNIGIITGGVSQLIVLDLDSEEAYKRLTLSAPGWVDTLTVKTGKGYHLYFSQDTESFKTFTFNLNGVHHAKSNSSAVVAPPSSHLSGKKYQFVDVHAPLLPLDEKVIRQVLPAAGFVIQSTKPIPDRPVDFTWAHELCRQIGSGERNTKLAQLVGLLIRKFPRDEGLIMGLAIAWNDYYCNPKLSTEEVDRTVRLEYVRYFER